MKKFITLFLVIAMVLSLAACGSNNGNSGNNGSENTAFSADDIADTMTSEDGKYTVAFVTDVGQLKDGSFNQGTYDGVKLYANEQGLSYKYYQPANGDQATDDDRYDAMKAAAENGAAVVVCAGFMQAGALERAAMDYPEVKFIFIDGWSLGLDNVAAVCFHEEQCGYLAGYAAVMEGYTKLGFCGGGGGTNPACCRYGYGYVQGAEAAAAAKNVTVDINYTWLYGATFSPSNELKTLCNGWYENGTEVIFSCGGSIFSSVTDAASANDAAVIGVDVDQSTQSTTVITSALKGIDQAAYQLLTAAFDGSWANYGNNTTNLGAAEKAVGLPTATWSLQNWSVAEYEEMLAKIVSGELTVDDNFDNLSSTEHVNLNIVE
ncbi:MAG: BMP family ABC transporter substrate-binding protein [Lachnospiraceae bacterium]|nr:BMP family ABC transporter substrate-binding protein [Lachnospiraceae bacterium]